MPKRKLLATEKLKKWSLDASNRVDFLSLVLGKKTPGKL